MKKTIILIFLFSFTLFAESVKIPIQGVLTDNTGVVLDGDKDIIFTLYNLDEGGDIIWSSNTQTLNLLNGEFSYLLGNGVDLDSSLLENGIALYLEVKVNTEILSPRVELGVETKAAFAYNSAKLDGKTLAEVKSETLGDILSRLELLEGKVTTLEIAKTTLESKVTTLEGKVVILEGKVTALENSGNGFSGNYNDLTHKPTTITNSQISQITMNQMISESNKDDIREMKADITSNSISLGSNLAWINRNKDDIVDLKTLTESMSIVTNNGFSTVRFTGVNLQIINGNDNQKTSIKNGKGNLIIGYNEERDSGNNRTGSHNLIIGSENNYTGIGSIISGKKNDLSGAYTSVISGENSKASNTYSFVTGYENEASGSHSSVTGGRDNLASGYYSSVTGGMGNISSSMYSNISGGWNNRAQANYSTVTAGKDNITTGEASSITGGEGNRANQSYASITGGKSNRASGKHSSINGGSSNIANGKFSTVSGGYAGTVNGNNDWRAGELFETD